MKLVILEGRRERAEAAGPPESAMLEVLRACREVHRAEGALREEAQRGAAGAAPSVPSNTQEADKEPQVSTTAAGIERRKREDLQRAQERLRAALRRAGASGSKPPGAR